MIVFSLPQGFCLPQELMAGGDGDGATEFHNYEGGGMGEGEGIKDVSDKIENEDQVIEGFCFFLQIILSQGQVKSVFIYVAKYYKSLDCMLGTKENILR